METKHIQLAAKITLGVFLLVALGTFFLPLVRVEMKPLVDKKWSAWEMVKPLPKVFTQKKSGGWDILKGDVDYTDVLFKILPKDQTTNAPSRLSLVFLNGLLVPIALIVAYLGTLLATLMLLLNSKRFFPVLLTVNFAAAFYAIFGVGFLGLAAKHAFGEAVASKTSGILGIVTKHFVSETVIEPDRALYVLCAVTLAAFVVFLFRQRLEK